MTLPDHAKDKYEDIDNFDKSTATRGETALDTVWDPQLRILTERVLVRKLDLRLLPMIIIIFIMNHIDRTAVTAARLKGLEKDLGLSDLQYDTVVAVLFASYCPMQIPSNIILNKVARPSLYIGICVVLWGLTSSLTGLTHNYAGMMACRVFLGIPESAFFPGATYLLSRWYTRKQLAFRSALLYCGLLLANTFGSLMAAAILGSMEGKLGIRAWRWLFYIEGAITIFVGFMAIHITHAGLPRMSHGLLKHVWPKMQESQTVMGLKTLEVVHPLRVPSAEAMLRPGRAWSGLVMAIKDIKVPIFMIMNCSQLLGLSFVNFFPTLAGTLGFSTTITLLLTGPPWIVAAIISTFNAFHADKTGERFFHITGWWWSTMVGYIIGLSTMSLGGRYVSMFLMASGNAGFALTLVWVSNSIPRPPAKRAAAIGLVNGFGNLGNLIGSFVWKAQWGPKYRQSMIVGLCAMAFSTVLSFTIRMILVRANRALEVQELHVLKGAQRERVEEFARLAGISFEEALERKKGFRYLY